MDVADTLRTRTAALGGGNSGKKLKLRIRKRSLLCVGVQLTKLPQGVSAADSHGEEHGLLQPTQSAEYGEVTEELPLGGQSCDTHTFPSHLIRDGDDNEFNTAAST